MTVAAAPPTAGLGAEDQPPVAGNGNRGRSPRPVKPLRVSEPKPPRPTAPAPRMQQILGGVLAILAGLFALGLINLILLSSIVGYTAQQRLFGDIRYTLAAGSTPTGPLDVYGKLVNPGTPVAVINAPKVGLTNSVIVEGTAGSQTMTGIGHRRDTALPCQAGTSVLMARAASYGAQGEAFKRLQVDDTFTVTMAQGTCTYQVVNVRSVGDPAPGTVAPGEGRVTLVTAAGPAFLPTEVYRVDADLVGTAFPRPSTIVPSTALPDSEQAMATDPVNGVALVFLLQLAVGLGTAAVWVWKRWGALETWLAIGPLALATGLGITTIVIQLALPNLM